MGLYGKSTLLKICVSEVSMNKPLLFFMIVYPLDSIFVFIIIEIAGIMLRYTPPNKGFSPYR